MPSTIVITGASSGIGAALARRYAQRGSRLALIARNRPRLEAIAGECRRCGSPNVELAAIDVRERQKLKTYLERYDARFSVDLVIASAGVMTGTARDGNIEAPELSYTLMETNVLGVLNTVHPLVSCMIARRRGQIAIIGSIAGFVPLADSPSYSASKSALLTYGLSLRESLAPRGVKVNLVCPGYVDTPMTDQIVGKKRWMVDAEDAAERIRRGIERNSAVIAFPFVLAGMARLSGFLPHRFRQFFAKPYRFAVTPHR